MIQWFPGHMTKARRMITEQSALVDVICEIADARIPTSSRNPDLSELTNNKPRLVILNRSDLADPNETALWVAALKRDTPVIVTDARNGKGVGALEPMIRQAISARLERMAERGAVNKIIRAMIVGVPNTGKSTLINRLAKHKAAVVADKPGVTRGKQWVTVSKTLELLDTPGILWPKIESDTQGENLAFTGAIKDTVIDIEELAVRLCERLALLCPEGFAARYKIDPTIYSDGHEILTAAARKRGFVISGGELDTYRISNVMLDEFRAGLIGKITLERVGDDVVPNTISDVPT